ncbi:type II toxin-antitoxin system VapC family toxin [Akkermansiaceae bacterium]|nr:type II toxin-antitoxin system VapC family toxin [Akkermansiaceae bacterium]
MADTNVLVRAIMADDPGQTKKAKRLFQSATIVVLESVLMETEWVLRSVYGKSRLEIGGAFRVLLALRAVQADRMSLLVQVISAYEKGFDFADALHRFAAEDMEVKTFDRDFVKKAKKVGWKVSLP